MIKLRQLLQAFLKTIHPRVYFKSAPETAVFPYLVYDFVNILDDGEGLKQATIDIDGWDDKTDTTALETLISTLNTALNKKVLTDDTLAVSFYLENILYLTDDDPRIHRRKYTYQARLFERSEA